VFAAPGVKLVWCEKPLAASLDEAGRLVNSAARRGVAVVVSYVRRWLPLWQRVKERVRSGAIGHVASIRVAMPNRLFSIQSHAVDLALFLGGAPRAFGAMAVSALAEDGEPAAVIAIDFASGAYGIVQPTGMRAQLLIEAEIVGNDGRLRAAEHDGRIALERFAPSRRFAGYRELANAEIEEAGTFADFSPFAAIAGAIDEASRTGNLAALDNGADALKVQEILAGAERAPWTTRALD
jgi:predicted dehydrogenase